jgi:outer membrane protein assembly factor BamD
MKLNSFLVISTLVLFSACSGYEKLLKSSDISLKYTKAFEYYNNEDFVRSATLVEQIKPYFRGSAKADSVNFFHARSLYGQRDYIMAGFYFKEFTRSYPRSKFAEESEYLSAYCSYLLSPRPNLDQKYAQEAIQGFRLFMIKYPNSSHVEQARILIDELRDKLVEKSFMNARLYYDLGYYKASIIALNNSLNEFPDTKYREELMFLILRSNFLLAANSIIARQRERYQETIDEYYSFISEFPNSQYARDAERIYQSSSNFLN